MLFTKTRREIYDLLKEKVTMLGVTTRVLNIIIPEDNQDGCLFLKVNNCNLTQLNEIGKLFGDDNISINYDFEDYAGIALYIIPDYRFWKKEGGDA